MLHGLVYWTVGKGLIGATIRTVADLKAYGKERVPREGGAVLAMNHMSYIDPPVIGTLCPRRIVFLAKVELHRTPGLAQLIRAHGTLAVRRGESDREAIRLSREAVRNNLLLGMFVEGTRQREGVPGTAKPGAAMVAIQEGVPVVPAAIHGSHRWRPGKRAPVSVAWGEPMRFDEYPRNSRGYWQATAEIEAEIRRLWQFLDEMDRLGRPDGVPPRRESVPAKHPAQDEAAVPTA
ncbi:MAG: 1-acyl-sn-glycerol-3-phosphate acyltransferase [Actinobacteria bacterium]|nr:MAG: 1-acyl-sn-glycerol-3-phosphate acyltransferase [Actinomycetota bacterium]